MCSKMYFYQKQNIQRVELTKGAILGKKALEEGISVCSANQLKSKQLNFEVTCEIADELQIFLPVLSDYRENKELSIQIENTLDIRTVCKNEESEKTKNILYSELVIAGIDHSRNFPIVSHGVTNQRLNPEFLRKQTDLFLKYMSDTKERIPLQKGIYDVLMFPEVMGVLVHEVIGHLCEADNQLLVETAKYQSGFDFGVPITVYDDPKVPNGWGSIPFDDEGNPSEKVTLVKDGKMHHFMTSEETAEALGISRNGHARCIKYDRKPIVRMTNTMMQPGELSKDWMMEEFSEGVIARKTRGGYMYKDFLGIDIVDGIYIKKGEKCRIGNCLIRGRVSDVINHIYQISADTELTSGRGCIKMGQGLLPVSISSPYVAFKALYIEQR